MAQKTAIPSFRQFLTRVSTGASSASKFRLKFFGSLADFLDKVNLSIRVKILVALCIVILLMGTTNVVSMLQVLSYSRQYDAIITNITTANSISGSIKADIDNEMWKIVSGNIKFSEGKQYEIIDRVNTNVRWMMANTDSKPRRVSESCHASAAPA